MYEGKPLVLVVGSTDTGRTPMTAALLRRALGPNVVVRTAGVLSHEGEGITPEAQMALEQVGIEIGGHISRPLRAEEHRAAELLLAVDRGTQLVLVAELGRDDRITCLPLLANVPDVLDPHRMPLGVWVAALRQLSDQVSAAARQIRVLLGITDEPSHTVPDEAEPRCLTARETTLAPATGDKLHWDRDEDMQRLLRLINGEATQGTPPGTAADEGEGREAAAIESSGFDLTALPEHQQLGADDTNGRVWDANLDAAASGDHLPVPAPSSAGMAHAAPSDTADRDKHVARMIKLLQAAEEMPEIVDWDRLHAELVRRLRAIAGQSAGPQDFTAAATLMIEGKLAQAQLSSAAIGMLCHAIKHLEAPLSASLLATIGSELTQT